MKILPKVLQYVHKYTPLLRAKFKRFSRLKSTHTTQTITGTLIRCKRRLKPIVHRINKILGYTAKRRRQLFPFALGALVILLPVVYLILKNPSEVKAAWFNDTWAYRKAVSVANSAGSTLTNYQVSITVDTATLITAGKLQADCDDIRITDTTGKLISHWVEDGGTGSCNSTTTRVWTKLPSIPTSGTTVYLYYGNSTAASVSNGATTFDMFDTFSGSTVDANTWTTTGSPSVSSGTVALSSSAGLVSKSTKTDSSGLGRLIYRAKQAATTLTGGKIGFSDTASLATHFNTTNSATGVLGSTEEQVTQTASTNLVSYHQLEETVSTDANQFKASGYLDTGKLGQAVSVYGNAAGTQGSILSFNGGAQISGNNYEHLNGNQGSISFWFKPNWSNTAETGAHTSSDSRYKTLFYNNDGLRVFYDDYWNQLRAGSGDGSYADAKTGYTITAGTWYHVVAVWNNNNDISQSKNIVIYANTSEGTQTTNTFSGSSLTAISFIGAADSTGNNAGNALFDDFAIYDRVLTTTEITSLYNSGTGNEAGYVADPSLKFYAKLDGSGTLAPVTYNAGSSASKMQAATGELTGGTNLILNGNMEAASGGTATSWTCSSVTCADAETANILFDSRSQKMTATAQYGYFIQGITVAEGNNYTVSFWAKATGDNIYARLRNPGGTNLVDYIYLSTSWVRYETVVKIPAGFGTTLWLLFYDGNATGWQPFYVDNVTFTPNLVDNGGMEGTYSSGLASGWSEYDPDSSGTPAEEGTTIHSGSKAQKYTTTTSTRGIYQMLTLTEGNMYLMSAWVKVDSGTAVMYASNQTYSVTTSSSSWTRLSIVYKAGAPNGGVWYHHVYATNGAATFYVDDVSVIPLDNVATSLKAWTPVQDTPGDNSTEMVTSNAGFETYTGSQDDGVSDTFTGWTSQGVNDVSGDKIEAVSTSYNGSNAIKLTRTTGYTSVRQAYTVVPGKTYRATVYSRGDGTRYGSLGFYDATNSVYLPSGSTIITNNATTTYSKFTYDLTIPSTCVSLRIYLFSPASAGSAYYDNLSFKEVPNPLSVHGDSDGVVSTTSGARGNGYTFDGSTGYLRQKTYDVNVGTITYQDTNTDISDDGQEFEDWDNDNAGSAEYMIVVTNSDNTTSWGYFCADDGGVQTAVYTTKTCTGGAEGFNGTSPSGKTPVGYLIQKTDFQITGNLSVGAWVKNVPNTIISKTRYDTTNVYTKAGYWLMNNAGTMNWNVYNGGTRYYNAATLSNSDNLWHLVVGTYDGSNIKLFIDGVQADSDAAPASLTDNENPMHIGASYYAIYPNYYASGTIDSPFVLSSALTADQIKDIYNSTASHYGLTTNLAGANSQPANSATPTVDANTYHTYQLNLLTASSILSQDGTTIATSSSNLPNTSQYVRLQNADTTNALTVDWLAVAKGAAAQTTSTPSSTEEKSEAPVGYWKFDEGQGTTANNSGNGGTGLNGSITDATWQTEDMCVSGKCLKFDGSGDYVDGGNNSSLKITSQITVSAWIKTSTNSEAVLMKGTWASDDGYLMYVDGSNFLRFSIDDGVNPRALATSTIAVTDNRWHYVVGTYTPSTSVSLYIDGKLNNQNTTSIPSSIADTNNNLRIGSNEAGAAFFNGFIDDVKVFPYARTAAQIKLDYNAGRAGMGTKKGSSVTVGDTTNPNGGAVAGTLSNGLVGYWKMDEASWSGGANEVIDSSGNANHGVRAGDATTSTTAKFGRAGTFDGTGDYVNITPGASLQNTVKKSVFMWVNPASSPASTIDIYHNGYWNSPYGDLIRLSASNIVYFYLKNTADTIGDDTSSITVANSTWTHIGYSWDGSRVILYKNGLAVGSFNFTGTLGSSGVNLSIGGSIGSNYFTGKVDETRIYNRALSAGEVTALYNWGGPPALYYNLDEKTGTTANDTSANANTGTLNSTANAPITALSPTWTQGKYGSSVVFNGFDQYISAADSNTLDQTGSMSLGAQVKPTAFGSSVLGGTVASKGKNYGLGINASPGLPSAPSRSTFTTSSITSQLSGTSINDVYFYDTTIDTDYGTGKSTDPLVWRFDSTKSWYTETIDATARNCVPATHDRCGSKEFPEKSYIVATNDSVYIFDAQENAMWMKFSAGGTGEGNTNMISGNAGAYVVTVFALDGELYVGRSGNGGSFDGLEAIKFTGDSAKRYVKVLGQRYNYGSTIVNRNAGSGYSADGGTTIVGNEVYDVHATVISGKTYVAVGTSAGVSLINETDGTVANVAITAGVTENHVFLTKNNVLYFSKKQGARSSLDVKYNASSLTSSSSTWGPADIAYSADQGGGNPTTPAPAFGWSSSNQNQYSWTNINGIYVTEGTSTIDGTSNTIYAPSDLAVTILQEKQGDESNGSVKYVTKDYVTEEMVGDIRGMWPLNGSGSIANAAAVLDQSVKATGMTSSNANGTGMAYAAGVRGTGITFDGTDDYLKQKVYLSAAQTTRVDTAGSAAVTITGLATYATASQPYSYMVVSTNCDTVGWGYLGAVISGDNLKVFSTKTGTTQNWATVPSGGTCNAFEVRKTDFQITGNLTVGAWVKTPSSTSINAGILAKGYYYSVPSYKLMLWGAGTTAGFTFKINTSYGPYTKTVGSLPTGSMWYYVVGVYNSSTNKINLYVNGVDQGSTDVGGTLNDIDAPFLIGRDYVDIGQYYSGTIDEPFVTAEALTADQIKRMYEVGKRALTGQGTNALNGSSNQVNAVAVTGLTKSNSANTTYKTAAKLYAGTEGGGVSEIDLSSDTLVNYYTAATTPAINHANINALAVSPGGAFIAALDSGVSRLDSVSGKANVSTTAYTNLSGVFDKDTGYYKLYENGALVGQTYVGTSHSPVANANTFAVGATYESATLNGYNFYGAVDDVILYPYARTPGQVDSDNNGLHSVTTILTAAGSRLGSPIAYYKFDEGQGPVARSSVWSQAGTTTNMLSNPSFETNTSYWVPYNGGSLAASSLYAEFGRYSLEFTSPNGSHVYHNAVAAVPSTKYTYSIWLRVASSTAAASIRIYEYGPNTYTVVTPVTLTTQWQRFSTSLTAQSNTTNIEISVLNSSGSAQVYYADGAQLEVANSMTPYCDGSLTGNGTHTWSGTAHASTSTCTYGQDGEVNGATWSNAGKFGKALSFDGTDDYVQVPDANALDFGTGNFTLGGWVNTLTLSAEARLLFKVIAAGGTKGYSLSILDTGYLNAYIADGTSVAGVTASSTSLENTGWHHIMFSVNRNSATGLKLYIDGKEPTYSTQTSPVSIGDITTSEPLTIGRSKISSNNYFNGLMDEVKIYPQALTADEVKLDYNRGVVTKMGALSTTSAGGADNSNAGLYCVPGSSETCTAPVAEWNFDEKTGQYANDTSGNGNTGTLGTGASVDTSDPTWTQGKYGEALKFDGSDDYVNMGTGGQVTDFTIEAWVKVSSITGGYTIAARGDAADNRDFLLYYDSSLGKFVLQRRKHPDAWPQTITTNNTYTSTTNWYHVTATASGSNVSIYVNGILDITGSLSSIPTSGSRYLSVGALYSSASWTMFYLGSIDQVRIFNYARSAAQVAWDYNKGGPVGWWKMNECAGTSIGDSSGNDNTGTLTIGATVPQTSAGTCQDGLSTSAWYNGSSGKYDSSINFDGVDDYTSIGTNKSKLAFQRTNPFSVSAWIKPNAGMTNYAGVVYNQDASAYDGWGLGIYSEDGLHAILGTSGADKYYVYIDSGLTLATWNHVLMTYDGSQDASGIKLYINGVSKTVVIGDNDAGASIDYTSANSEIGRRPYSSIYFSGRIDDARVYNYALNTTQIKTLYNQGSAVRF